MGRTLDEAIARLPAEPRKQVEARVAELIKEHADLDDRKRPQRELRKLLGK